MQQLERQALSNELRDPPLPFGVELEVFERGVPEQRMQTVRVDARSTKHERSQLGEDAQLPDVEGDEPCALVTVTFVLLHHAVELD